MPTGVSRSHGVAKVAVFAYNNSGHFIPFLFSSDAAANKFGPVVEMTDSNNFASIPPPIAYDSKRTIPNARSEIGSPCFSSTVLSLWFPQHCSMICA
jgi:hypothetical protein